jgi:Asp-tRNA(Asn)/Glu-tRNA(Gln) amidotransferase A subunit family amidase
MRNLNELSAASAARAIAKGEVTSEALVTDCLLRIEAREPDVQAWQYLDPEYALAQARTRDGEDGPRGPLHGVPVAIKDIIDTFDMPTGYGSPIYDDHQPDWDAACVALIRSAGAVIMGKTVSSEFAGFHQNKTNNPNDPTRSPGISSMGSAAAVADFHVPLAFGSQTGASIIKPAAYCGAVGFKPSFGTYNLMGVHPLAQTTDTLGFFARDVADLAFFGAVLGDRPGFGAGESDVPPRIGYCRTSSWDEGEAAVRTALDDARARLEDAGAAVIDVVLPPAFDRVNDALLTVLGYDSSRVLAHEYRTRRDDISPAMVEIIERGMTFTHEAYMAALHLAQDCRAHLADVFEEVDFLLTPSAECEATPKEGPTGPSQFIRFWTLLHPPSIHLPTGQGPQGLPVGVQLIGPMHGDSELVRGAAWVEARLR